MDIMQDNNACNKLVHTFLPQFHKAYGLPIGIYHIILSTPTFGHLCTYQSPSRYPVTYHFNTFTTTFTFIYISHLLLLLLLLCIPIGFCIKPLNKSSSSSNNGCELGYVTHSNPRGQLPPWMTNRLATSLAPRLVKRLHKACIAYPAWKLTAHGGGPLNKCWLYPEKITSPKIIQCEIDVRRRHSLNF